jgi:hypothetical protein
LPHGNRHIPHHSFRLNVEEDAILDIDPDGQPTIQTRCIYPNGLPGKKPADCQRLKSSLAEPLLLAIDPQPVLGGEIVERGKGDDIIRPRE